MVRKSNFLSISVLISAIFFFWLKRKVLCEFLHKCFKTTEKHSLAVLDSICGRKTVFVNICHHLLLVWWKTVVYTNPNFPQDLPLSNMVIKKKFWVFQCCFLQLSLLCLKRKVLYEFPQKCFKTTERHSLAVCGSVGGENRFC